MLKYFCVFLLCQAGFPPTDDCQSEGEQARAQGKIMQAVMYFLLSSVPEMGLETGLKFVKGITQILNDLVSETSYNLYRLQAVFYPVFGKGM